MYFKKSKNKKKSRGNNRGGGGGGSGNNGNSRQRRKNKNKREPISEAQRLAIVNAVSFCFKSCIKHYTKRQRNSLMKSTCPPQMALNRVLNTLMP